jgi:hypothetical protein
MRVGIAIVGVAGVALAAAPSPERGLRAFDDVAAVLKYPRCLNCHVPGDSPLQGDEGRPHNMNVKRGAEGRGTPALPCTTCHQTANTETPHAPPGAPDWRLPPPSMRMAWLGLDTGGLCETLKDPARNGGRSLAALEEHVRDDALVKWGFNPGPGRRPPRLSHPDFVARFVEWKDAGAPCPARKPDAR